MNVRETTTDIRVQTSTRISDLGNVRMGGMSPSLPPVRKPEPHVRDEGKVRLGGMSPAL
jgi:hypothetical protein